MKQRIMYRRARVTADFEKAGACQACRVAGRTEMHHHRYAYSTSEVRKSPHLALDNTVELCYKCHRIADALRKLFTDPDMAKRVLDVVVDKIKRGYHGK